MGESIRLDRFLWFARIVKTRPLAQALAENGHFRIDGRAIDRAHCPVRVGNILTFAATGGRVRVLRVEALPVRRGPAPDAAACYQELLVDNVSQQSGGD
jgi:ribosome-associated heat shock protein Hsp15